MKNYSVSCSRSRLSRNAFFQFISELRLPSVVVIHQSFKKENKMKRSLIFKTQNNPRTSYSRSSSNSKQGRTTIWWNNLGLLSNFLDFFSDSFFFPLTIWFLLKVACWPLGPWAPCTGPEFQSDEGREANHQIAEGPECTYLPVQTRRAD